MKLLIEKTDPVNCHVEELVNRLGNTRLLPAVTAFCYHVFNSPVESREFASHLVANPIAVDVEARDVKKGVYSRLQVHGKAKGIFKCFFTVFGLGASAGDIFMIEISFAKGDGT